MGNVGSNSGDSSGRRNGSHGSHPRPPSPVQSQPEITGNRYVFTAATPYPQYPSPNLHQFHQYPAYYPSQDSTISVPFPYHRGGGSHADLPLPNLVGGRHPCGLVSPPIVPYVEHQKAVTIRNEVNLKKETLRIEPDEGNPGQFLVSFILDATVPGSITVIFFAKEGANCSLTPTKENLISPVTVSFQQGLGQKFRQPSGTGINFSMFEETELMKNGDMEVYPLAVKAVASVLDNNGSETTNALPETINCQITQAVFDKEKGEYQVRVVKRILWVNGMRYELQEIYGIGNSVDHDFDGNDPGKECVICLSEPQDTTVLPCRHMCMCSGCAKVLRFQTNRCPICRQPVERLLEIKISQYPYACGLEEIG